LDQELLRPVLDRFDRHVELVGGREDDAGDQRIRRLDASDHVERRSIRQPGGHGDHIRLRGLERLESDAYGRRLRREVVVHLEEIAERAADARVGLDEKDSALAHRETAAGRVSGLARVRPEIAASRISIGWAAGSSTPRSRSIFWIWSVQ